MDRGVTEAHVRTLPPNIWKIQFSASTSTQIVEALQHTQINMIFLTPETTETQLRALPANITGAVIKNIPPTLPLLEALRHTRITIVYLGRNVTEAHLRAFPANIWKAMINESTPLAALEALQHTQVKIVYKHTPLPPSVDIPKTHIQALPDCIQRIGIEDHTSSETLTALQHKTSVNTFLVQSVTPSQIDRILQNENITTLLIPVSQLPMLNLLELRPRRRPPLRIKIIDPMEYNEQKSEY